MAEHEQETVSRAELDAVLARLATLEAQLAASPAEGTGRDVPAPVPGPTGEVADVPVDRRALLRRGGLVAGAVAAGTAGALLNASPAAAAPLVGDGNPGVTGTGVGGPGVVGTSASGDGVVGSTTAPGSAAVHGSTATGIAYGVLAEHTNGGVAVRGTTTGGPSGALTAVWGQADQTSGIGVRGTTSGTSSTGVSGESGGDGGVGVKGSANGPGGYGVVGFATASGVVGQSMDGMGVHGLAAGPSGVGVRAENGSGIALHAVTSGTTTAAIRAESTGGPAVDAVATTGYGALLTGGGATTGANLRLVPNGPAAPSRTGTHLRGEVVEDQAGDLWLCTAAGLGGAWRKLAGPATAGAFHVLGAPVRIYDSRTSGGVFINATRAIDAKANASGVPAGATAVLVNLAVTNTSSGGYGALWTNGTAWPGTANINWGSANMTISNTVVTAVDATALFQCKIAGTADVIVDVIGYYR